MSLSEPQAGKQRAGKIPWKNPGLEQKWEDRHLRPTQKNGGSVCLCPLIETFHVLTMRRMRPQFRRSRLSGGFTSSKKRCLEILETPLELILEINHFKKKLPVILKIMVSRVKGTMESG